jgi:hypothetical protein
MKWILASALLFAMAVNADEIVPPDLFKQNSQVYSGHAEFLYWTVTEGASDYALQMRQPSWGPSPSYAQGKFENANFDLDPGFRVALVYFRAPHYWEVRWQYTRIACSGHDSIGKPAPNTEYITGTWPQITTAPLAKATSHIHLHYNVFDMNVDRVFFPNPHLRLRVIGGVVVAWINQDWKVRYTDSTPNSTTIRNKWDFAGAGLKAGTWVDWFWTHNIYMTAQGGFGLLIGNYTNHAKQKTTVQLLAGDNTAVPIRNTSYQDARPTFTAQMLLGPSWQKNFPKNRVEVFAGFEMNFWFNLQEIYRSTAGISYAAKETWLNSGLLSLYGLTTRISVDF